MSAVSTVAVVGLLVALLLGITALLVWQEARRRPSPEPPAYVIEDAVSFIHQSLAPEHRDRLGVSDVRRVIEWEVHYLQGLAQRDRRSRVDIVAGGSESTIDWIAGQIAEKHGVTYSRDDIKVILAIEAAYLASIGAVGEPVRGDE